MNYADYAGIIGLIIGLITAVWNITNGKTRTNSIGMLERGQYLESVNKSIELANKRAFDAEERASKAEDDFESEKKELLDLHSKLEERISVLERDSSFKLIFDVNLGAEPKVEHVEITRFKNNEIEKRELDLKEYNR